MEMEDGKSQENEHNDDDEEAKIIYTYYTASWLPHKARKVLFLFCLKVSV